MYQTYFEKIGKRAHLIILSPKSRDMGVVSLHKTQVSYDWLTIMREKYNTERRDGGFGPRRPYVWALGQLALEGQLASNCDII